MSSAKNIAEIVTAVWKVMPRWARWVTGVIVFLWLVWSFLFQERHGGASIIVHSVTDRPISYVYVNGNMGSNTFAFDGFHAGGGGTAGPYSIDGKIVRIDWLLSTTGEQFDKGGLRPEKHSVKLPMPKRNKGEDDFCVLMWPENKVHVRWSESCIVEMNKVVDKYRTWK